MASWNHNWTVLNIRNPYAICNVLRWYDYILNCIPAEYMQMHSTFFLLFESLSSVSTFNYCWALTPVRAKPWMYDSIVIAFLYFFLDCNEPNTSPPVQSWRYRLRGVVSAPGTWQFPLQWLLNLARNTQFQVRANILVRATNVCSFTCGIMWVMWAYL